MKAFLFIVTFFGATAMAIPVVKVHCRVYNDVLNGKHGDWQEKKAEFFAEGYNDTSWHGDVGHFRVFMDPVRLGGISLRVQLDTDDKFFNHTNLFTGEISPNSYTVLWDTQHREALYLDCQTQKTNVN